MKNEAYQNVLLLTVGSESFRMRTKSVLQQHYPSVWQKDCSAHEAWSIILGQKPNLLLYEIGYLHNENQHNATRDLFEQIRDRFENSIYIVPVITHPEKLYYAGDLLFQTQDTLDASTYIDSFLVPPPATTPGLATLSEQLIQLIPAVSHEFTRRERGEIALPPLGTKGWVQSLADPQSRDLWMKWLPKYAQYSRENPLIIGATGTGKTNLAYALHHLSGRKGEFISITPRDFSSSELVQAELFGAVAGAYTGAVDKWGLVKAAEKGTLFIDELQSIDRELQGKLITFIENKTYRRVGSAESTTADVRFVFASNRELYSMMEESVLRDDFAYRLERILLDLKPLRLRKLDIPAAFAYGLAKIKRQRELHFPIYGLTPEAYRNLFAHDWPGNLRQLENAAAKMCERAEMSNTQLITQEMAREVLHVHTQTIAYEPEDVIALAARDLSTLAFRDKLKTFEEAVQAFKNKLRVAALEATGGDIKEASELLEDNMQLIELTAQTILADKEELGIQ